MVNCPHTSEYQIYASQVSYNLLELVEKGQYVQKGTKQDYAGREEQAFLQYFHGNELQYVGFFLLLLQFERQFSDLPWTQYITKDEWECIIHNFFCQGVDIRPLLEKSCIYLSEPSKDCNACDGEGIGDITIDSFYCPFVVYPGSDPSPDPMCSGEGIAQEIIEGNECSFNVY